MGFIGATPTPVPLTNSDLDSNIALGGNVDTIGDSIKIIKILPLTQQ